MYEEKRKAIIKCLNTLEPVESILKYIDEAQIELLHQIQTELNTKGLNGIIEYCENKFKQLECNN